MNCLNLIEIRSVGREVIENIKCDEDKYMETELKTIFPSFKIELKKQMNETEDLSPILFAMEMQVLFIIQEVLCYNCPPTQVCTQEKQIASTCSALTQITCLVTALGTREGRMWWGSGGSTSGRI